LESSVEVDIEPNKPYNIDNNWDFLNTYIKNVITAFRLLKSDFIEANIKLGISKPGSPGLYLYSDHGVNQNFTGFLYWGSQITEYKLDTSELAEVRLLAKKLLEVDFTKRGTLRIALDRFEKSCYETYFEDLLIDCMIAFEALLIRKNCNSKKRSISFEAAKLLCETEEKRQEISSILKTAYEIRNCIVHGSDYQTLPKEVEMATLTRNVENILRNCIKKVLLSL